MRMLATQTIRAFWQKISARIRVGTLRVGLTLLEGRRVSTIGSYRQAVRDGAEQPRHLRDAH
eukprot:6019323-Prymnesium_polylepis.1